MKTYEDFLNAMRNDPEFAEDVSETIKARVTGEPDVAKVDTVTVEIASEKGYSFTTEDIKKYRDELSESISEEELGKVAGGFSCGWAIFSLTFVSMTGLISVMVTVSEPDPNAQNGN